MCDLLKPFLLSSRNRWFLAGKRKGVYCCFIALHRNWIKYVIFILLTIKI